MPCQRLGRQRTAAPTRLTRGSLTWLLSLAAEKRQFGERQGVLVRDPTGEVAGWFVYYCHTGGGVGEVLQLAERRSTQTP